MTFHLNINNQNDLNKSTRVTTTAIIMYSPYISPLTSDFYLIYWWTFTYKYIYPVILNLW